MSQTLTGSVRGLARRVDWYIVALFGAIGIAALVPAEDTAAEAVSWLTKLAIGLLFFLYGARLSPQAALDGVRHWRLHLPVLALTFAAFPLLGLAARLLPDGWLGAELTAGVLFLAVLPSTVQSSIALTSLARGNVAAALCSASFSTVLGVVLTPVLAVALIGGGEGGGIPIGAGQLVDIAVQLLLPFAAGQAVRRWISGWLGRHRKVIGLCDRGSILLVVYAAFSRGMTTGIWQRVSPGRLVLLGVLIAVLLAAALLLADRSARALRLPREDRVTAVFCGATKSLASGLPMASVLFPADEVAMTVLPLMLYHTLQLVVCAALARRLSRTAPPAPTSAPPPVPAASTPAPPPTPPRTGRR
ncbi:bile acid:sodium symporter family protein [Streptomyces rubradiris]|uniref:Bile acid:sodium symporter n=1 Tax=Streptomyces rubradiris TaxID=285531 RepID=A0ABQ3RL78_STRRR|nr:bile acid:sodium symporter family protein [Streptomyces rubradiris]GHH11074.1 bile acid:sodium symporter [Streptomyces rubradiris]GHI56492.1 bile acid:sodium symporter [Streptomyces rubradiris]